MTSSIFDQHLPRTAANHAPLSPLDFIERTAQTYPERLAIVHGSLRQTWGETYARARQLASARFGYHYDPASGLVRYPQSQGHLKSEWHSSPASGKPEAQFFARCNPRHATGEELVCLTRLEADNLRSFALRGFLQGLADGALET